MRSRVLLALILVLWSAVMAGAQGASALDKAKEAMHRGDYRRAIMGFREIANSYGYSEPVQREAAYFIGFCEVKLGEVQAAVASYENFLRRFDNGNAQLVPDALYVLGQSYEHLGRLEDARNRYAECRRRFPATEFARKSADRLAALSGPGSGSTDVFFTASMNMSHLNSLLAKGYHPTVIVNNTYYSGTTLADLAARGAILRMAASQQYYSGSTLEAIARSGTLVFLVDSTYYEGNSLIRIAQAGGWLEMRASQQYYAAVTLESIARSGRLRFVVDSTYYPGVVLTRIAKAGGRLEMRASQQYYPGSTLVDIARAGRLTFIVDSNYYSQSTLDQMAAAGATLISSPPWHTGDGFSMHRTVPCGVVSEREFSDSLTDSDPFAGMAMVDEARTRRIHAFIGAVQRREGMREAARKLAAEDLRLGLVRRAWKEFQAIAAFERVHGTESRSR